jgi:hypothetical protein
MIFKLGKLPARANAVKLKFSNYSLLPTPPETGGHYGLVSDWDGLLGNDQYGDCVWAGGDHEHIYWNDEAGTTVTFTAENALADYASCTGFNPDDPSSDKGTDMQVAASYRLKTGLIDNAGKRHKIEAYVALTVGNENELRQAINLFGAAGIGINFPASAMTQFNEGKPWSVVKNSKIEGGHYIPAVGYDTKYIYIVTWGKIQKMEWAFYVKYSDEALVYLTPEMLINGKSREGFDLVQLQADQKEL